MKSLIQKVKSGQVDTYLISVVTALAVGVALVAVVWLNAWKCL
jgi:hypothetical protein